MKSIKPILMLAACSFLLVGATAMVGCTGGDDDAGDDGGDGDGDGDGDKYCLAECTDDASCGVEGATCGSDKTCDYAPQACEQADCDLFGGGYSCTASDGYCAQECTEVADCTIQEGYSCTSGHCIPDPVDPSCDEATCNGNCEGTKCVCDGDSDCATGSLCVSL